MEYKGFKYSEIVGGDRWNLVYPSGFGTSIPAKSEEEVKQKIDYIIENLSNRSI